MPLQTTVIGSMPKPKDLGIPCWVTDGIEVLGFIEEFNLYKQENKDGNRDKLNEAIKDVILLQESVGLDVITDGELNREKYIYEFCRKLEGFDFQHQKKKLCRNGAWEGLLPKIVGKVSFKKDHQSSAKDWAVASGMSKVPVKFTIPGPMTIADTMVNEYYATEAELYEDLIFVINAEIKDLASAGCKFIQIDEPVLARYPDAAVEKGINNLTRCFDGLPEDVLKIVHCCCGYPQYLDQTDYVKADQDAYLKIAEKLDDAGIDAISIEDAHRRNSPELFKKFKTKKIILGVVDVVKSRIETVEEIQEHIQEVLKYIPRDRLIIAPDCGLVFLTRDMVVQKLSNLVKAAHSF